jgi:Ser-tRNA(Ala) deacylase AlaX
MKPGEGRLQSGEHIMTRFIQNKISDITVRIAKFFEDYGEIELISSQDLRGLDVNGLNLEVNSIIQRGMDVEIKIFDRGEVEDVENLRIPEGTGKIRIVSIGDFDSRPCGDPHVSNTFEIGRFIVDKIRRVGKDRYRFTFHVEDN